jgi:hypothetical protein
MGALGAEGGASPKLVQIRFSGEGGKTCYFELGSVTRTNLKDRRFRLEPSMQYFFSAVAVLSSSGV